MKKIFCQALLSILVLTLSCQSKIETKFKVSECLAYAHGEYFIYFKIEKIDKKSYFAKTKVNQGPWSVEVEEHQHQILENPIYQKMACPQ